MCALVAALTDGGKRTPRILRWLGNELRHPVRNLKMRNPSDWAKETIILLVMQTLDNYFHLKRRRPWFFPFAGSWRPGAGPNAGTRPGFRPGTISAAGWRGGSGRRRQRRHRSHRERAHNGPHPGRVFFRADARGRRHRRAEPGPGLREMIVCDGSQIPENLGVNPALSITAFAERAMSFIPPKKPVRYLAAEKAWGLDGLLTSDRSSREPRPPAS